jgi:hypothetical protein
MKALITNRKVSKLKAKVQRQNRMNKKKMLRKYGKSQKL